MLDKSKINLLIDALMFLCMMAIAGLGFLMKFVLIPGKDRAAKYGRGVELFLLDLDRHEWGTIHLIIGFTLLTALVFHIILHWKMIVGIYERLIENRSKRRIIAAVFVVVGGALILFPFAVKPEIQEMGRGHAAEGCGGCPASSAHSLHIEAGMVKETLPEADDADEASPETESLREVQPMAETPDEAHPEIESSHEMHQEGDGSIEIRGYMTLAEVAAKGNVPVDYLKERLGVPESTPGNERLGRLRREYGFTMGDVGRIIQEYGKTH